MLCDKNSLSSSTQQKRWQAFTALLGPEAIIYRSTQRGLRLGEKLAELPVCLKVSSGPFTWWRNIKQLVQANSAHWAKPENSLLSKQPVLAGWDLPAKAWYNQHVKPSFCDPKQIIILSLFASAPCCKKITVLLTSPHLLSLRRSVINAW